MKRKIFNLLVTCLAVIIAFTAVYSTLAIFAKARKEETPITLNISSAASLKDVMAEITTLYKKEKPNVTLTFNYGSSGMLQQQIEQGAPSDIFISAGKKQVDALKNEGLLLNDTINNLAKNRLVLVVNKDSKLDIKDFKGLTGDSVKRIAMGQPDSVPAGQYAEQVLKYYKVSDKINDRIVYAKDVKEVLTWVETGNADAGFVYKTDAKTSDKVKVAAVAPENTHSPILYPEAVVKASKNISEARAFLSFLQKPKVIALFKKYEFEIPTTTTK